MKIHPLAIVAAIAICGLAIYVKIRNAPPALQAPVAVILPPKADVKPASPKPVSSKQERVTVTTSGFNTAIDRSSSTSTNNNQPTSK